MATGSGMVHQEREESGSSELSPVGTGASARVADVTIAPLEDYVILKSDEVETIGETVKFYLPENAQGRCTTGIILAIGPGRYLPNGMFLPTTLRPGQRVLYDLYGTQETKLSENSSQKVVTMREAQVRAVLTRVQ